MPGAGPPCRSGGTDGVRRPGATSSPPAQPPFGLQGGKGMKHLFKTDAAMLACLMRQGAVQPAFAVERTPKRLRKRRHGRKPAMRLCVQSGRAALPGPGRQAGHQAGHQAGRRAGRRRGPPLVREGLRAGGEAAAQFSLSAMYAESWGVRRTARARKPAGRRPGKACWQAPDKACWQAPRKHAPADGSWRKPASRRRRQDAPRLTRTA